jgi:hypothetical protein
MFSLTEVNIRAIQLGMIVTTVDYNDWEYEFVSSTQAEIFRVWLEKYLGECCLHEARVIVKGVKVCLESIDTQENH